MTFPTYQGEDIEIQTEIEIGETEQFCVRWLVEFLNEDISLPDMIQLPKTYPFEKSLYQPTYSPFPFCGYTFLDVEYSIVNDSRLQEPWTAPWLTQEGNSMTIDIRNEDEAPQRRFEACMVAQIKSAGIKKVECVKIVPYGQDPDEIILPPIPDDANEEEEI